MATRNGYVGAFYLNKQWALGVSDATEYAFVSDDASLDFGATDDFSVEAWVRVNAADVNSDHEIVAKHDPTGTGTGWKLASSGSDFTFETGDGSTTVTTVSAFGNETSDWTHLVGVRDADAGQILYQDGEEESSDSTATGNLSNSENLIFGEDISDVTQYVGLVRVYDRVITVSEVSDLYNGDLDRNLISSLAGEWLLNEGSGTSLYDSSGNGLGGTVSGARWGNSVHNVVSNEAVGTGDGSTKSFSLAHANVDPDNGLTVTVDGNAQRIDQDFGLTPDGTLKFTTAPGDTLNIVASYRWHPMTFEGGGFTGWSVDVTADAPEQTTFADNGWRSFRDGGIRSWTGTAERHWINPGAVGLLSRSCVLRFYLDEANDKYYSAWGVVTGFSPSAAVDALVEETLNFQGSHDLRLAT